MTRPRIVYVHGAGPQEHPAMLKRRLDGVLFGANQLDGTLLTYYADVLHAIPPTPGPLEAGNPDAAALEAAFAERASAVALTEAGAGGDPPGVGVPVPLEGVALPDPAFLAVAAIASTDVISYLIGNAGPRIRQQVSAAIPGGEPIIVLAHSLGTIVAYDVLCGRQDLDVRLLITVGSPLGIANVQRRIGDRSGPPAKVPPNVAAWRNYADPFDPVALELTLADEFVPTGFVTDAAVDNKALLNHDLAGYLATWRVRRAITKALAA